MSRASGAASFSGTSCLKATASAFEAYRALGQASQVWQETEQRLSRLAPRAAFLLEDFFLAFYDPESELNAGADHDFAWNFSILASVFMTPEFKQIREMTSGDVITSASAALHVADSLAQIAEEDDAARSKSVVERVRRLLSRGGKKSPSLRLSLPTSGNEAELRYWASRCARRAQAELLTDQALRASWGVLPGVRSVHAFDDVWRLLAEIRKLDGFVQLTDVLGRFREILSPFASERNKRRGWEGVSRIAGYTWGRDLDRVAPEEMVRLLDPEMSGLFFEAYDHMRLLQHDIRGERKQAAGPIICCMDVSASMNTLGALERERFLWCKGLGLALLDYSVAARRPFLGLCFSSEAELEAFAFPVGGYSPERALEMARCDFNGGTHFERPLRHALEHAEGIDRLGTNGKGEMNSGGAVQWTQAAPLSGVDVVFVADGEASLRSAFCEEFRRRKAQVRLHLYTVFIDGYHPELAALSDAFFTVRSDRIDSWEGVAAGLGRRLQ